MKGGSWNMERIYPKESEGTGKQLSALGLDPNVWSLASDDERFMVLTRFGKKPIIVVFDKIAGTIKGVSP